MRNIKFYQIFPFLMLLVLVALMLMSGYHAATTGVPILGYITIGTAFAVLLIHFIFSSEWRMVEAYHGFQAFCNEWLIKTVKSEQEGELTEYEVLPQGTLKLMILVMYFPIMISILNDQVVQWILTTLLLVSILQLILFSRAQLSKIPYSKKLRQWKE
jgi:hypothetical protein